eukprot:9089667-Pyramimonas_sp.AAC.1
MLRSNVQHADRVWQRRDHASRRRKLNFRGRGASRARRGAGGPPDASLLARRWPRSPACCFLRSTQLARWRGAKGLHGNAFHDFHFFSQLRAPR